MNRITTILAIAVLTLAGGLVVASPAVAAGAQHMQNRRTGDCIDQHFKSNGAADIMVYAWPDPCHNVGNEHWVWEALGDGWYRVVNNRWDPATGRRWCLSAPERAADNNRVYAEYCLPTPPPKQKWARASITAPDSMTTSLIHSGRVEDMCIGQHTSPYTKLYLGKCWDERNNMLFRWIMS
ncbi:RICIN domain-containing protein [Paractinoplanes maris]|uniref:RICIN domain-containing protein n=1 Tax=Paractinoplanes maris TaxID=1734446 RepID=UPI0020209100|nr:hypothetical protein [Actinoplanes maris]